ncbi:hypothetical protein [Nocardia sp. NPDC004860]|uniref:hypothetical protein n=1 Tax=Nocardia sp. NPDC004860 TaxID=3154557 RepID=UPI0033A37431
MIHRDDWDAIAKTAVMLQPGLLDSKAVTPTRIRAHSPSGWQPVTITSRRFPGEVGSRLHIVRIARADQRASRPGSESGSSRIDSL